MVTKKTLLVDRLGNRFIVGIARDITERKQAEVAVIRTRRNFEAFFNSIDEFLYVLDEQGRMIYTNETVPRLLGYPGEELLGKPVVMVHPSRNAGTRRAVSCRECWQAPLISVWYR